MSIPMNILRRAAVALILGLIGSAPVTAHNGAVAHAPALSGIVVDGDLSDWPQQTEWMPIALVEYGFGLEGLEGEDDLKAWHAIGYGDAGEVFYVAVKVEDDDPRRAARPQPPSPEPGADPRAGTREGARRGGVDVACGRLAQGDQRQSLRAERRRS